MLLELPWPWITTLNVLGIPAVQLGLAWTFTQLPTSWFRPTLPTALPDRPNHHAWFGIHRWKDRLPDGASWFKNGIPKASLSRKTREELISFAAETRRGEACHWSALFLLSGFCLWNPPWAIGILALYALIANLPCILVQRHNRRRLFRILHHLNKGNAAPGRHNPGGSSENERSAPT